MWHGLVCVGRWMVGEFVEYVEPACSWVGELIGWLVKPRLGMLPEHIITGGWVSGSVRWRVLRVSRWVGLRVVGVCAGG